MGPTGEVDDVATLVAVERAGWWVSAGKLVAATVLILLAGALLAGSVWALHYQPLTGHGGGWVGAGRVPDPGFERIKPGLEITNAYGTEHRLTGLKPGERIGMVFGLHNDGPFPVQITAIGSPVDRYHVSDVQAFQSESPGRDSTPYGPLRPFTLGSGEMRSVAVTMRLSCNWPTAKPGEHATVMGVFPVPVTYRFLGLTHTANVPQLYALTLNDVTFC